MIRILHISDLHFCIDAQSNNMKNVLLSEARKVHNLPRGKKLLIITGDFHNFSSSDYKLAKEFIDRIVAEMDIEKEKDVFIVPGNHDVGNETALNRAGVDPMKSEAAILGLRDGRKKFLSWRLEAFVPFCQFAHEIGVYSDGDNLLPAKVHVRCWRGRLNILHLNTALVAESNTKDNQVSDIDTAASDNTWNLYRDNIPAIALGHNSFYDLEADQQTSLKTMFVHRNVSAYLCGDTHRINVDENKQNIILESNTGIHPLTIKNVVCAKGISEVGDNYSDFGCYWHIWNEDTDKVEYKYRRLTPHTLAKTVSDSTGDGEYVMRRKSGDIMTPDNSAHSADVGLRQFFANLLLRTQENHPSFVLLKRDEIDERLFPQAAEMKQFVPQGRTEKTDPSAVFGTSSEIAGWRAISGILSLRALAVLARPSLYSVS